MEIQGFCDDRFAAVRDVFIENFTERNDIGASFAVTLEGEYVVDIWGGHRDAERTTPWDADTLVNVYSTSKTMTFISALVLADRGQLDFNAPVTQYWPEYGVNGKQGTLVSHFMSHTAGVPGFVPRLDTAELCDWNSATANLAAQVPWWEPGTQSGYHAITQGFLIGELVRRITGKSFGTFFREEIAGPMSADFHIGLEAKDLHRVSDVISAPAPTNGAAQIRPNLNTIAGRTFASASVRDTIVNSAEWRHAEIPAANGHGNARAVVQAQTALANGGRAFGVELLSPAGCRRALEQQTDGKDVVLGLPIRFGMGYALPNKLMPMSPKGSTGIFWGGFGGSTIVVDLDRHICLSYVMNRLGSSITGGDRGGLLGDTVYKCLE